MQARAYMQARKSVGKQMTLIVQLFYFVVHVSKSIINVDSSFISAVQEIANVWMHGLYIYT
jgi:hypothetical protein